MNRFRIPQASAANSLASTSGDSLTMDDRRVSSRINQSRTVRIRPAQSQYAEEIRTTLNVSWDGFYFATSVSHYFSGMIVYVTKDFLVNDSANREEQGVVVRVDQMKEGRWGIAVHLTRDIWRNRVT